MFQYTGSAQNSFADPDFKVYRIWAMRAYGQADSAKLLLKDLVVERPDLPVYYELARTNYHLLLAKQDISTKEIYDPIDNILSISPDHLPTIRFAETVYEFLLDKNIDDNATLLKQRFIDVLRKHEKARPDDKDLIRLYMTLPPEYGGNVDKGNQLMKKYNKQYLQYIFFDENTFEDYYDYWLSVKNNDPKDVDANLNLGEIYLFRGDSDNAIQCFKDAKMRSGYDGPLHYFRLFNILMKHVERNPELKNALAPLIEKSLRVGKFGTFLQREDYLWSTNSRATAYFIMSEVLSWRKSGKAEKYLRKANEWDPFHSRYWEYFPPSQSPREVLPGWNWDWNKTIEYYSFMQRVFK